MAGQSAVSGASGQVAQVFGTHKSCRGERQERKTRTACLGRCSDCNCSQRDKADYGEGYGVA